MVYCLIPRDLAPKLHEPLRRHFRDDPSTEVVVECRSSDRRAVGDRRKVSEPRDAASERRRIRSISGRRISERRASLIELDAPELPRKARPHADRLLFVERLEPSDQQLEDADTARLVMSIQAGDADAFSLLYMRYFDRVYSYLRLLVASAHDAEEVAQQVFLKVLEGIPAYERRQAPFRGWLFTIVRNQAVNQLARSNRLEPVDPHTLELREDPPLSEHDIPALDWISDGDLVMLVQRLPLAQRQVLLLRFMVDLPHSEIANILGRSPTEVRKLQFRATTFLRDRLTALGRAPQEGPSRGRRAGWRRRARQAPVLRERRFALLR
jgi:RNA polymerase sigma-70 factor (ECF subfamily)